MLNPALYRLLLKWFTSVRKIGYLSNTNQWRRKVPKCACGCVWVGVGGGGGGGTQTRNLCTFGKEPI